MPMKGKCIVALAPLQEDDIRYVVSRIDDLPPLPTAIRKLMEIVHAQGDSPANLEEIVRQDPSLAAKILRIANSTFFGNRGGVSHISRAMVVIGLQEVRSVCLCSLLLELFSTGRSIAADERERLWKHAFATGRIAREIVRNRPWIDGEEAYLLGLMHDLGRIVMAIHYGDHYRRIVETARSGHVPPSRVESSCGLSHTKIGGWLGVKWALPEVFQKVMEFHHDPFGAPSFQPEVKLIRLADILAGSREYPELPTEDQALSCCSDLFITEEEWHDYQGILDGIFEEVDWMWDLLR